MLAASAGLALGSFAVTAGLRAARRELAIAGRSRCDSCGKPLGFAETLPVASYMMLRGACAGCGARIDTWHLAGEVAGGLVLALAPWDRSPVQAALTAAVGLSLIAAAAADGKSQRLPDALTVGVAAGALALAFLRGGEALLAGLAAATLTAGLLLGVRWALSRGRTDPPMGLGDVKLAAALAVWLGPATPLMIFAASLLGLAAAPWLRDGRGRLPFGPMLAGAGWVLGLALEWGWSPWEL